jgi:hypothetical protein
MKRAFLLLSFLTLTVMLAAAQAMPASNFASPSNQAATAATQGESTASDLRGCLSGSNGNYTLVDHQGKAHRVTGDNHMLWDDEGHEVDMTGSLGADNTFHETQVMDIDSRCWNFSMK